MKFRYFFAVTVSIFQLTKQAQHLQKRMKTGVLNKLATYSVKEKQFSNGFLEQERKTRFLTFRILLLMTLDFMIGVVTLFKE